MEPLKKLFYLDPEVTFFNHGSFGACPKQDVYQNWQLELEKQPVEFWGENTVNYYQNREKLLQALLNADLMK